MFHTQLKINFLLIVFIKNHKRFTYFFWRNKLLVSKHVKVRLKVRSEVLKKCSDYQNFRQAPEISKTIARTDTQSKS